MANNLSYGIDVKQTIKAALELDPELRRLRQKRSELGEEIKEVRSQMLQEQNLEDRARTYIRNLKEKLHNAEVGHNKHQRARRRHQKKLADLKRRDKATMSKMRSRTTEINHRHRGVLLRDAYKELGLPIPKSLEKVKPVVARDRLFEKANQLEDTNEMEEHPESG
jgi:uncharacterized coiled-coil DUF342 family protein